MVTGIKRTEHQINGRLIAISSWFDPQTDCWQAIAPDFSYLPFARTTNATTPYESREDAVEKLVDRLVEHVPAFRGMAPS